FVINIEQAWAQYFTHISATCVHSARCGTNLVMEPDGKLYACDHLINSQHYLGQLANNTLAPAVDSATRLPFGIKKSQRRECQRCSVKIVCQGGCPAHINSAGYNRLCSGYYSFFTEILAPLRAWPRNLNGLKAWRADVMGRFSG
ncbi:SPASM domain-containing protein, partial [Salmonella enterica subsp. enterica serovar Meleagridis]|nr:SPASM domain-containing protein [Salmonella enterica subsp. enterica serovar Meleagridis]